MVVVSYNTRDHLLDCVASVYRAGAGGVIVVDNASNDGSPEAVLGAFPQVRLIRASSNLGYGAAANLGWRASSAPLVAVANPDLVVSEGALARLRLVLENDPRLALVGPRLENPDGSLYPSARRFPALTDAAGHAFIGWVRPHNRFSRRYKMLDEAYDQSRPGAGIDLVTTGPGPVADVGTPMEPAARHDVVSHSESVTGPVREVDWVSGAFFVARRFALEALGGFDEGYFMYMEDVDLCWRARRAGWRVAYVPRALVTHHQGAASGNHPYRMAIAHHKSLARYAWRTTQGADRAALPAVAVAVALRCGLALLRQAIGDHRGGPHRAGPS